MKYTINIPVEYEIEDNGDIIMFSTEKTDITIGSRLGMVVQERSLERAEKEMLAMLKFHIQYIEARSDQLDRWKPFQKGNWSHIGGTWLIIFGISIYFRTGKDMQGGWYIPLTKLNISIHNHWRK